MIKHGCALNVLKTLEANSIDSIVTDPPYGLSFMGKKWDYDVPSVEIWREALRVLKPGGHLLSFGGTRTYHRMVVNIEDAGFEIRDQVMWLYGSGFPKSQDVSKQIDKQAGAAREVLGISANSRPSSKMKGSRGFDGDLESEESAGEQVITAPATPEAQQWEGWGTALKPANEPICLARKPLEKGLTVAANVLKYGTGAMNIDASRIGTSPTDPNIRVNATVDSGKTSMWRRKRTQWKGTRHPGRWPANLILDEEAAEALDEQSGPTNSPKNTKPVKVGEKEGYDASSFVAGTHKHVRNFYQDSGGASRFFYIAKASKRERNAGMPEGETNGHPTIKPIKLMEYLIKLVTPMGGIVLDPFMGSGTTGVAAKNLGFEFIGIEREAEYVAIAEKRIEA